MKDVPYETHPAYGVVGFNRTSGSPGKMFGSAIPQHGHFVTLTIKQAQRKHDLYHDWIMGRGRELITVWLSAAQFAELLTSMNIGDGVPCTIRRLNGKQVEEMPQDEQTETEKVHTGFEGKLRALGETLRDKTEEARDLLLTKGGITMAARRRVVQLLDLVHREVEANLPFALTSFQEAVEKTTVHAKAELDAMVTHVVTTKGLEALGVDAPKALPKKKDPDLESDPSSGTQSRRGA